MDSLTQIVKETVAWYVGGGFDHEMYGLTDDEKQVYAVIAVDFPVHQQPPKVVVMVRIVGDVVVIEEDRTDRSVEKALIHAGVAPEKVVRIHAGETLPDADRYPYPAKLMPEAAK